MYIEMIGKVQIFLDKVDYTVCVISACAFQTNSNKISLKTLELLFLNRVGTLIRVRMHSILS